MKSMNLPPPPKTNCFFFVNQKCNRMTKTDTGIAQATMTKLRRFFVVKRAPPSRNIHSSFIIHHSSFIIHHSPFIINHSSFIIHHPSFIIHHSSFIIHHSSFTHLSFIIHHSSFIIHHSPFIINHSSFIIHHPSFIIHHSSFIINHRSIATFAIEVVLGTAGTVGAVVPRYMHSAIEKPRHFFSGFCTGHDPARGSDQEVAKKLSGRVGSGRVGSRQEDFKYHGSSRSP